MVHVKLNTSFNNKSDMSDLYKIIQKSKMDAKFNI